RRPRRARARDDRGSLASARRGTRRAQDDRRDRIRLAARSTDPAADGRPRPAARVDRGHADAVALEHERLRDRSVRHRTGTRGCRRQRLRARDRGPRIREHERSQRRRRSHHAGVGQLLPDRRGQPAGGRQRPARARRTVAAAWRHDSRQKSHPLSSAVAMPETRRHLSMLRSYTRSDALTIGNAACGMIAIFLCLDYLATGTRGLLWIVFVLLPLALVFDALDGYVARLDRTRQSAIGADLDSLADVISFGVAPAVLGFTLGLRGGWDMVILTGFVVCGVSRLARFNVTAAALTDASTGKVKYFEGTPITSSLLIVLLLGAAA